MRLIGEVQESAMSIDLLDDHLQMVLPTLCSVATSGGLIKGEFLPTKWGGNFGTDVIGYNGIFTDTETGIETPAHVIYAPDESKSWQLYFAK